jgi:hypothetical protein
VNAGLIGVHESQALSETGKWGLEFHIVIQDPFAFPSAEIQSNVLQNCWRHEWFRQGSPQAARLAAEDIAIPLLDPLRVHHTEYHIRTVDAGYERVPMTSWSEWIDPSGRRSRGMNWNAVLWPWRKEVKDGQNRYTDLRDQILLKQKELMLLLPGYRFVRGDTITPTAEYVPMLDDRRCALKRRDKPARQTTVRQLLEAKLRSILAAMKQRAVFRSPTGPSSSPLFQRSSPDRGAARRVGERGTG